MATSTATLFASGKETTKNENVNEERTRPPRPSRKKDNFLRKKACTEQFCRVEDTLNKLFEDVLNKKTQLHEDVDNLQQTLKDLMDSSDNTVVEDALRNEIKSQAARLQKAESENSELQRKVEYQADAFGKSQSEVMQIRMENSDLKKKLEKLTSDFEKSESKFKQDEMENSDLKKKLEKMTSDFKKSESKFEQTKTENYDLKKELNQFKMSEGHFTTILTKHKEEKDSLQVELEKYKVQVSELEQNLEQSKKENDQMSLRLKESDERLDSWEKVAQTGATQQNGKNAIEAEINEDGDCANVHQDIIDLMDNWFQTSYSDIFTMAIENRSMEKSMVEEILFYTLWKIYTNSRDAVMLQLNKLRKGLYYPYSSESIVPDVIVAKDINNGLKKLLAKVEIKEEQGHFRGDLMTLLSKKHVDFPIYHPKFTSYLNASINLCRQLVLKSEYLHLKTFTIDARYNNSEYFLIIGKKADSVKRTVIPALIYIKNNVISVLRKGTVSTT